MTDGMLTGTEQRRDSDLVSGDVIAGRFEIVSKLAEGGMGKVYVAIQQPIGRKVALKVLRRELATDDAAVKRFFREAVAASKLHHPNTITIIDYGEGDENTLFIAMELLDGESLHELLGRETRLPLRRAVNITAQIGRSLSEAHKKGVIHRDLKPENIFISCVEGETDLVKVLDFGIAKLLLGDTTTRITRAGYVCGTPEYMSPEQARGEELDGTSDLYALGILLWEMLCGTVPYEAPTPLGTVLKHQNEAIPTMPGDTPAEVKRFLHTALAKSRDQRPQTADEFMLLLAEAIPGDYAAGPDMGRITGPRRSMAPSTPPPLRQTGAEMAMAPTMGAGGEELEVLPVEVSAKRRGASPLLVLVAVAGALLGIAGLGLMALMFFGDGPDAAPQADPVAPAPVVVKTEVQISATPRADVFRGDRFVGQTPWITSGEPGQGETVSLRREGFKSVTVQVTYPDTGRRSKDVTLDKTFPNRFKITLASEPVGAMLVKDGRAVGAAPHAFDLEKADAPFEVELRLGGYETQTVTVDPSKGAQSMQVGLTAKARAPASAGRKPRKKQPPVAAAKAPAPKKAAPKVVAKPPKKKDGGKKYRTVD
jgi:tRNA A-37 threonylcarbamoyl transferase component Bud32